MPRPSGRLQIVPYLDKASGKRIGTHYTGTIEGQRIRIRTATVDGRLAAQECTRLEAKYRQEAERARGGVRFFRDAVEHYIATRQPHPRLQMRLARLVVEIGDDALLDDINQATINRLREKFEALSRSPRGPKPWKPATVIAELITPIRAVLHLASASGWTGRMPKFAIPRLPEGRTVYLQPDEAERLIEASGHLAPLIEFLVGTGARLGETLRLDWSAVDLSEGFATFEGDETKTGRRRHVELSPRVVAALANLPHKTGRVFRTHQGRPYSDHRADDNHGGQIKTAWQASLRRAGLDIAITPHGLRHTFATWHYALHRDVLGLKLAGGWRKLEHVERYTHPMKARQAALPAIARWFGQAAYRQDIGNDAELNRATG